MLPEANGNICLGQIPSIPRSPSNTNAQTVVTESAPNTILGSARSVAGRCRMSRCRENKPTGDPGHETPHEVYSA